jgi:uncharacterized protein
MSRNQLGDETSPYLLQHKDNPVHWRAWGAEALAEAKATGKPILLSVGYAACHWCHVMAHESFEDDETAAVMNELYVNIKVDREERPDIDAIYMGALHRLGQQGGWPLTMFLDGEGRPFWGGTYFPKVSQFGRPAFTDILRRIAQIYRDEPDKVAINANAILDSLKGEGRSAPQDALVTDDMLSELTSRMTRAVDEERGGIRGAPKFPQWSFFWLLWRGAIRYDQTDAKTAVVTTLSNICQGGIYDHLGGGFARYAVDERWLVPHFEKMLYDNALLIDLLTEVWRETQSALFETRVEETVDWLLREMIAEGGAFASSLDADSEGEEGKFYVWTPSEIESVLGREDASFFCRVYDVSEDGNWEGHSILNRLDAFDLLSDADEARLQDLRAKLLAARADRVRPGWDDKVLADWNGLMIGALARAAQVFDRSDWMTAAEKAFTFVAKSMTVDGRLRHSHRDGRTGAPATASDYANMIWGALRLYQATLKESYLTEARGWTNVLVRHYLTDNGGFATTADDTEDVIVRMVPATDDATPNANAMMLSNLSALALLTGEASYKARAEEILAAFSGELAGNLIAHAGLLAGTMDLMSPQVVTVARTDSNKGDPLAAAVNDISLPGALVFVVAEGDAIPSLPSLPEAPFSDMNSVAYCCIGTQCSPAITDPDTLRAALSTQRLRV